MTKLNKFKIKNKGQIYTPDYIVNNILDLIGYEGDDILEKHIIDNSSGDGAFLIEIVKRYCNSFIKKNGNNKNLKLHLEKYIHGIEIQQDEFEKSLLNLNLAVSIFGLENVKWDIINSDTLLVSKYDNKMDFVVGNPPYVRVHNLKEDFKRVKDFLFCKNGMTDLYIVFFEIGFRMLNNKGKMGLITPSSFLNSNAGIELRRYILEKRNLSKILDLEHFQPFNATTYTLISIFEVNKKRDNIEYFVFNENTLLPEQKDFLDYDDILIGNKFYISKKEDLIFLKKIENFVSKDATKIEVKNGFATLADSIFIDDFKFSENVIDILKASTGKWSKCLFPYNKEGKPLSIDDIKINSSVFDYLLSRKNLLENRSLERNSSWFLFGRSQGIKDVFKDKIAINTIIKDKKSIKIQSVPSGAGVYSGLYILTDFDFSQVERALKSDEFIRYIKMIKKYKSGGYYTFSSNELKKFLNYKLTK